MMRKKYWIQDAIGQEGALKSYFQKKLKIPKKAKIPKKILKKIVKAKSGQNIVAKYRNRKARIKVTGKLKKRANLALTLRKFQKKKSRRRRGFAFNRIM